MKKLKIESNINSIINVGLPTVTCLTGGTHSGKTKTLNWLTAQILAQDITDTVNVIHIDLESSLTEVYDTIDRSLKLVTDKGLSDRDKSFHLLTMDLSLAMDAILGYAKKHLIEGKDNVLIIDFVNDGFVKQLLHTTEQWSADNAVTVILGISTISPKPLVLPKHIGHLATQPHFTGKDVTRSLSLLNGKTGGRLTTLRYIEGEDGEVAIG